jgi:16S rRNA (uracil1498-N3)-methyltransferase
MSGTVHRFFVPPATVAGRELLALPASIAHQVQRVLRLHDGERLVLLEGDGIEHHCLLAGASLSIVERRPAIGEPRHRLTVVQALLKGDRLEMAIRAATEVGAATFRLVVTERCVVRELSPRKLERLRAVAREAAEQSERGVVPGVLPAVPLVEAIGPGSVLLWERGEADLPRLGAIEPPEAVVIGPEGGFTPGEVAAATEAGATRASLGPRVLRSETVGAVAAAVILSRSGDFA